VAAYCPKCSGEPIAVLTTTARIDGTNARFDLSLACSCSMRWQETDLPHADALAIVEHALSRSRWVGTTRVSHALLLELAGKVDDAYEEYAAALRCTDAFGREYCHERRAAYELQHRWLRTALRSLRAAKKPDACEYLERQLTAQGIPFVRAEDDDTRWWQRACELEQPPGFGAVDERGQPLADDVIEVERLLRAMKWDDAIHAMRMLDAAKMVDAIRYASRGVTDMLNDNCRDKAVKMQWLVVEAYEIYASWSTSGGEGMQRMRDVDREKQRLREL
jgi:hypothetical protein